MDATPIAQTPASRPAAPAAGVAPPWLAATRATSALLWPALAGRRWGPQRLVPGIWYRLLHKPPFQPPDKAIPLAWTAIDTALAVGAYRLLRKPAAPARTRALGLWALNVGMIGAWSGIFFGLRNLPASTAAAAAMVGTGAAYVAQARRVDPPAAVAGVPFVAWVGFATVLTAALWQRNRR
jgi:tryptophan-rich sensory protein